MAHTQQNTQSQPSATQLGIRERETDTLRHNHTHPVNHTYVHPHTQRLTSFQNQLIKKHGPLPQGVKDKFEEFNPGTQIRAVQLQRYERTRRMEGWRMDGP